ncbi:MAG: signal peptide peptidase SppA [Nitrospinae bacterium CG22_combo_CG10-13_8_21_14_all_47_10]|nr:MAG: signal peptide peptidase SppA [Nitrospinae bacterium CG22_combo_CG10-13_8_21_14_all_47_10]
MLKEYIKPGLVLFTAVFFASACASIQLGPTMGPLEETVLEGEGPEKLLLIDLQGVIHNKKDHAFTGATTELGMVEQVREILSKAEKDDDIRALLVKVNSPGGTVTASDIILHELVTYKRKHGIPIYVHIMDLAASGGYYVALAGDEIAGHPTSLIGSIGVIALKVNLENLMEKIGVDWEVVKSGDKKDFMSPFRSFTDEERKLFQDTIDNFHTRFVTIIAENRTALGLEDVKPLADGRVFDSQQAMKLNLIDRIGYISDTVDRIKLKLEKPHLKVVTYQREGDYKSNLYSISPQSPAFSLINLNLGLDKSTLSPYFLYLWMP